MLQLNEKMIRKGKPVGLPYKGSKKKVAKKIIEIIKQNFGEDKTIYDIFGGGGAITAECLINGLDVRYNDLDSSITNCFNKIITSDRDYLKTLLVSRDEFLSIRDKEYKTTDDHLKLLINSFGNNRKNYLYNKEISDLKYQLAVEIIEKHDTFSEYKKTETYNKKLLMCSDKSEQLKQLQQLSCLRQLEQIQRLNQLEQIQQLNHKTMTATNYSYEHFSDIENSILYLDPPYENAMGYSETKARTVNKEIRQIIREKLLQMSKGSTIKENGFVFRLGEGNNNKNRLYYKDTQKDGSFNSQKFYDWAFEMSKHNTVILSSYEVSDERFEVVYEFKTARSTLQGGAHSTKYEKLFMVK